MILTLRVSRVVTASDTWGPTTPCLLYRVDYKLHKNKVQCSCHYQNIYIHLSYMQQTVWKVRKGKIALKNKICMIDEVDPLLDRNKKNRKFNFDTRSKIKRYRKFLSKIKQKNLNEIYLYFFQIFYKLNKFTSIIFTIQYELR